MNARFNSIAMLYAAVLRHLPLALFAIAVILTAFAYGVWVGKSETFPYRVIADGVKTARAALGAYSEQPRRRDFYGLTGFSTTPPAAAAANRIESIGSNGLADPLLWFGGQYQFMEHCPDYGCMAVAYNRAGAVDRVWPYRPDALERAAAEFTAADSDNDFPYEQSLNFSFGRDVHPVGVSLYTNGDLLVIFQHWPGRAFPYGAGVARINPDGAPVWFRRDYSHHWARLLPNDVALVPSLRVGDAAAFYEFAEGHSAFNCDTGKPYLDAVHYIDGQGSLLQTIDLAQALLESPFALLPGQHTQFPCDPLHLNFIDLIGDDYAGSDDIAPGDLVLSLRNVSAFAILDGADGRVKRVVRGTFARQHSVHHLHGATFLMFDNQNLSGTAPERSRLLMVDLASGQETTIFPNDDIPDDNTSELPHLFTRSGGYAAVSPDRERALVVFTLLGLAVEVRLTDGKALNVFRNLHDLSDLEHFPDERNTAAGIFNWHGLDYIRRPITGGTP